ncbi:MAG: T9SS type A sorting domain-containing protein [Sphingobacteriaceae bacterium]
MKVIQTRCMFTLLVLLTSGNLFAGTVISAPAGGNWNSAATWVGNTVPQLGDQVIIAANTTVWLTGSTSQITALNINVNGSLTALTINGVLNLAGPLRNDGFLKLYVDALNTAKLFLRSNSLWAGNGTWSLSQLSLTTFSLEFDASLVIDFHETITGTPGSASLNSQNKRTDIRFNFIGDNLSYTIPCEQSRIFYGSIRIDMGGGTLRFYTYGSDPLQMNAINLAGDLYVDNNSFLDINTCNILTIKGNLDGTGQFMGGNTSDIVISGNGVTPTLYMFIGSNFQNLTVNRPSGLILGNSFSVIRSLTLNNSAVLRLPKRYNTTTSSILTLGSTNLGDGNLTGNGFFQVQDFTIVADMPDLKILGNAAIVKLRFIQSGQGKELHNLTINKSAGVVVLDNSCDLKVRNDFTLSQGQLGIAANTLTLMGQIKSMSASGSLTGSTESNLIIGNEVSSANATLYFTQTNADSRTLKTYRQLRDATIRLGNLLEITEEVNLSGGTSANMLETNSNLLLRSSELLTARVANLGLSSITDSVYVQRFIKGGVAERRNYKLLSSPVYQRINNGKSQYYFSRLQDDLLITGPGGVSNGFDNSVSNGSTILFYKEQSATAEKLHFPALSNISNNHSVAQGFLTVGNGNFFFFRGDRINQLLRKTTPPFPVPESVTAAFKGLLNQGEITVTGFDAPTGFLAYTFHNEPADGLNLLGNPYASAIDWESSGTSPGDAIELANVGSSIYMLDPVTRTYGTYQKGGLATGSASRYISSGQGFMVQATADQPKLIFREAAKVKQQPLPLLMGRPHQVFNRQVIRLELRKDSVNKDDILLVFDGRNKAAFNHAEDSRDAGGLNAVLDLSSLASGGEILSINALPDMRHIDEVKLFAHTTLSGNLSMHWNVDDTSSQFELFFEDRLLQMVKNMRKVSDYHFAVNKADSTTFGKNRFRILIKENIIVTTKKPDEPERARRKIFPNPAHNHIYAEFPAACSFIKALVIDVAGRRVIEKMFRNSGEGKYLLNTSKLKPGAYILRTTNGKDNKPIWQDKFIIY